MLSIVCIVLIGYHRGKRRFTLKHSTAVQRPYAKDLVTMDDIKLFLQSVPPQLENCLRTRLEVDRLILQPARHGSKKEHGKEKGVSRQVDRIAEHFPSIS